MAVDQLAEKISATGLKVKPFAKSKLCLHLHLIFKCVLLEYVVVFTAICIIGCLCSTK